MSFNVTVGGPSYPFCPPLPRRDPPTSMDGNNTARVASMGWRRGREAVEGAHRHIIIDRQAHGEGVWAP